MIPFGFGRNGGVFMFEKGEFIMYGSSGVCQIEEIGPMEMSGAKVGKLYYTLLPVYTNGSKIFTPVDNTKIVMRKIMTKQEAMDAVIEIPEIEPLWIEDEKKREELYKETLRACTFEGYIKVIKTLFLRQQSRLENGKRLATVDERYLKMAQDGLYGELAISLSMDKEDVVNFITEQIEGSEKVLL